MSWAKIDDRLWSHPKFLGLSLSAAGLWLFGLSYAASLERDGWFPGDALSRLTVTPDCESFAHELVHAGLWIREPDGYRIHDYLRFNRSRKQLVRQRKKTANRVRALRTRNAVSTPLVTRLPARPGPSRPGEDLKILASARTRATRALRATTWPEDFRLTEDRLSLATEQRLEMPWEWNKFKDHHRAKGSRFVDWDAAWRTWIRHAVEFAERRGG
jgi:hypothetical protein